MLYEEQSEWMQAGHWERLDASSVEFLDNVWGSLAIQTDYVSAKLGVRRYVR